MGKMLGGDSMKLFLIRHGQTVSNNQKVYVGQTDVMLTQEGREQAMAIRPILEKFTFDRVYSSDLQRAVDTQLLALPFENPIRTPLLREIDVGSAAGKPLGKLFENAPERVRLERDYSYFGGESRAMACDRLRRFLAELEEDPCEYVAAFAHNGICGSMMRVLLGEQISLLPIHTPNCGIHVFEYANGVWRLKAWNYMGKL